MPRCGLDLFSLTLHIEALRILNVATLHTLILKTSFTPWILAGPFHYLCFVLPLLTFLISVHTQQWVCITEPGRTDRCLSAHASKHKADCYHMMGFFSFRLT